MNFRGKKQNCFFKPLFKPAPFLCFLYTRCADLGHGAGGIQLTIHDGHAAAAEYFGMPPADVPAFLRTPVGACRSAASFWWRAGCNAAADRAVFDGVSNLINIDRKTAKEGDAIGFADRKTRYLQACRWMA